MNTTSIMDESRVKPIVKKKKIHPHNDRKETNIHKVQKTLVKIISPKGNCLEARPKTMDEIKCTWVTIKRSKTMDQTKKKKKRKRNTKDNLNVKVSSL